ncbi:MAG: protease pro-enzyme activation domain-containing protein [Ktedonobacterales bacterium]
MRDIRVSSAWRLLGKRSVAFGAISLVLVAGLASAFIISGRASAAPPSYVTLPNSYLGAPNAHVVGSHASSSPLTVTLVLQPSNAAKMNDLLTALYDPSSPSFHDWLAAGQFDTLFAPTAAEVAQATQFVQNSGLQLTSSPSPFLLRATGSTAQVESAFRTSITDYRDANGKAFFANSAGIQIPASLSSVVIGVSGLANTAIAHPQYVTPVQVAQKSGKSVPLYGGGPDESGLTPSQTAGIYDANGVYATGPTGQGRGKTLAVFELSGYTPSDITTYEHQFFGRRENVPLVNVNVDGGPINQQCPTDDICVPYPDYSGDIEVEADIEMEIAIAPKIDRIIVYNAPNDYYGITEVDEYFKIAQDDVADSISSSWAECEQDAGVGQAEAENVAFTQMALQGQSMFSSSGDTGAFSCLRDTGSPNLDDVAVLDPGSQPFVTSVGGTSFETFDPGTNLHPTYPYGSETVWNVDDLCNNSTTGLANCVNYGAGGGGNSVFWGKPFYQQGPGVTSSYSTFAPSCELARPGQQCREVPDVSADADEYTGYAEYCTGNPSTNSTCAFIHTYYALPDWFGIGGTSLSSPLWAAVISLYDSYHNQRFGNANFGLYDLFNRPGAYSTYFHEITGAGWSENNNGLFPTTPNYNLATGIGTPRISAIAEARLYL